MHRQLFEPRAAAWLLIGALFPVGVACTTALAAQPSSTSAPAAASTPTTVDGQQIAASSGQQTAAAPANTDLLTAIRSVSQEVRPAVVQITNQQQVQTRQFSQPFVVPAGVGSGFIYDDQGHILTNDHVIEGAQQILVSLPDKRSFPGTVVGTDPQDDLAVIQIQGDNLPVAQLGDSSQLQVGDWVVTIGNALALPGGPTVTQGVVSALGRTVQEPGTQGGGTGGPGGPGNGGGNGSGGSGRGRNGAGGGNGQAGPGGQGGPGDQGAASGPFLFDVVQTDALINPGNSGGPLVNLQGQVVGINTLVAGQAEPGVQAQGIGFAISMATAKPIADQLVQNGQVVHPYLGIQYVPLNPAIAAQLGTQATDGVVIGQVVDGSPAATVGLQPMDILTAIDGQSLQGESALAEALNGHKPGDSVTLSVLRGQQQTSVQVQLGTLPAS